MNTRKEYHRAWRAANPDKVALYKERFRAKHPGYFREHNRKWCEANPEKVAKAHRKWREANPDYDREYREAHPGYNAEVTRRYKLAHPGEHYQRIKIYRKTNPEKQRAHGIIRDRIKRGTLKRLPCETCGNPKSHAHHVDYSKPLDVRWLCALCHKQAHQQK